MLLLNFMLYIRQVMEKLLILAVSIFFLFGCSNEKSHPKQDLQTQQYKQYDPIVSVENAKNLVSLYLSENLNETKELNINIDQCEWIMGCPLVEYRSHDFDWFAYWPEKKFKLGITTKGKVIKIKI